MHDGKPAARAKPHRRQPIMTDINSAGFGDGLPGGPQLATAATSVAPTSQVASDAGPVRPRPDREPLYSTGPGGRSRWWTLAVLAVAQFMVVLDVTIVNVAL